MPPSLSCAPRKMFPPPMTIAISQPRALTSLISSANDRTVALSMPYFSSPPRASPVTLRMTRLYLRTLFTGRRPLLFDPFANLVPHEAPDLDVLSHARDRVPQQVADLAVGVLDEGLLDQTDFRIEAVQFALDDLIDDLFRLALLQHLSAIDGALALDLFGRHVFAPNIARSFSSAWYSGVRATKSVSQLSSTMTPILPPA